MLNIGILYGGRSGEHDVSLCSAASVISALNKNKYNITAIGIDRDGKWYVQDEPEIIEDSDFGKIMKLNKTGEWYINHFEVNNKCVLFNAGNNKRVEVDFLFPVIHGTYCEDGTIQGLLELAMVPYAGADLAGSVVGMDKDIAKRLLRDGGISVVPWVGLNKSEWEKGQDEVIDKILDELGLPLFIKPCNAGSSVGIKKVKEKESLRDAIDFVFDYDNKILVEKAVNAREIECAVLGNEDPIASIPGEVVPKHEFYSYEAKYIDPNGASLEIPAKIDESLSNTIGSTAVAAYKALCCNGMARVDFFLEKDGGNIYLNEINTIPGFTNISMYPKLWEHSGIAYSELLDRLIELGMDRHKRRMGIKTEL